MPVREPKPNARRYALNVGGPTRRATQIAPTLAEYCSTCVMSSQPWPIRFQL